MPFLIATGCGGDEEAPVPQSLVWSACQEERFECTNLSVPVDHDQPDAGPMMTLPVIRWPALSPAERLGTVLYLAGGPGQSGVDSLPSLVGGVVPGMGEVVRRFDIVGIDTRGTGASQPAIHCVTDEVRDAFPSMLESAADDAAADALVDDAIAGCRSQSGELAHYDSVSAVQDLELLRQALGEEQLSLLGISYGTWLSSIYAVRYPDRVRAGALASAFDPSNDVFDRVTKQVQATEAALVAFFEWCDANMACAFRPTDGSSTRAAFDELGAAIADAPLTSPLGTLDIAVFRNVVFRALYDPDYATIGAALASARDGDPNPVLLASLEIAEFVRPWADALVVIRTLDDVVAAGANLDSWRARLDGLRTEAPSFGALMTDRDVQVRFALRWTDHPSHPFAMAPAHQAAPLLLLSNRLDPITPADGAASLAAAFGNGSMQLVTEAIGHYAASEPCALARGGSYLVDPSTLATSVAPCPTNAPDYAPIGTVSDVFPWTPDLSRAGESALGDLICDAMRVSSGARIAVMNGGGIRTALPASSVLPEPLTLRRPDPGYAAGPPYDIVVSDVRAMLPFGNRVATIDVTGARLWAFLEYAVSQYSGLDTGTQPFVQVSGIHFAFDADAAPGARMLSLSLDDGTAIANDDATSYSLAMPDYVWYGGTGYYLLAEGAPAPSIGITIDDAVIQYFRDHSLDPAADLEPVTADRITAM